MIFARIRQCAFKCSRFLLSRRRGVTNSPRHRCFLQHPYPDILLSVTATSIVRYRTDHASAAVEYSDCTPSSVRQLHQDCVHCGWCARKSVTECTLGGGEPPAKVMSTAPAALRTRGKIALCCSVRRLNPPKIHQVNVAHCSESSRRRHQYSDSKLIPVRGGNNDRPRDGQSVLISWYSDSCDVCKGMWTASRRGPKSSSAEHKFTPTRLHGDVWRGIEGER